MRSLTQDKDMPRRFYVSEQLGDKQAITPEGFLVINDVPICRTGELIYGPNEVPVTPSADGRIRILREEQDVFSADHITSYEGKPVTNDHPPSDVNPSNWNQYAVGTVLNPRRGTGLQADLLIADFIITNQEAIEEVRQGKREVSCGYDADYEEVERGIGRQKNLCGNHVALVERGRCGQRCAIGDEDKLNSKEDEMKTRDSDTQDKKTVFKDTKIGRLLFKAFKAKDEEALEELMQDAAEMEAEKKDDKKEDTKDNRAKFGDAELESFMKKNDEEHKAFRDEIAELKKAIAEKAETKDDNSEIAAELEEEAPAGTKDKAAKARDSMYLEDSFKDTVAMAEILSPGIRIPTFDKAASPKQTFDSICQFRKMSLDLAYATNEGRKIIEEVNGKALDSEKMSCGAIRQLFRSSVAVKRNMNKFTSQAHDKQSNKKDEKVAVRTPADLNRLNSERYKSL